jgi:hypothetical protein
MKNPMSYTKELIDSGFTKDEAHSTIKVVWEIMEYKFASKDDLSNTQIALSHQAEEIEINHRNEIKELDVRLSTRIDELDVRLSTRINEVETNLKNMIQELDARLSTRIDNLALKMDDKFKLFEKNLIIKIVGLNFAGFSVISAFFKWIA